MLRKKEDARIIRATHDICSDNKNRQTWPGSTEKKKDGCALGDLQTQQSILLSLCPESDTGWVRYTQTGIDAEHPQWQYLDRTREAHQSETNL
jgi:hypothetical protein